MDVNYKKKGGKKMSHFYGDLQGNRGEATRCGSRDSGISSHVRGWNVGVSAHVYVNSKGEDECSVRLTSGSNGYKSGKCLGTFTAKDLEEV